MNDVDSIFRKVVWFVISISALKLHNSLLHLDTKFFVPITNFRAGCRIFVQNSPYSFTNSVTTTKMLLTFTVHKNKYLVYEATNSEQSD